MAARELQDTSNHELVEWENGAENLDEEFRNQNCVEIELNSDDDVDLDDCEDENPDEEFGVIDEKEIYSDDDMVSGVDDSVASASHKEAVLAVAVTTLENQCIVATGGQDDVAILWRLEDTWGGSVKCKQQCRLEGHTDSVVQVEFSHDGKYLATAGYDGIVKIWTPGTGALVQTLDGPAKEIEWIMWHPKGHAICAGSSDTMAWMWFAPSGKLMQIFAGHAHSVTCGSWGLGGKLIVTGSEDQSVIVWDPRQGTPKQHAKQVHESAIVSMCSHPDAPLVVTGSCDASAKVLHIETGKIVADLSGHLDSVEAVGFNNMAPGGILLLATASMDGKAMIWDGKTFDLRCTLTEHFEKGGITKFRWLPQKYSNLICTCATDATSRLFDALTGQCLHTCQGHTDTVLDIDLLLVGGDKTLTVVSGSDDSTCRIFTVPLDASAVVAKKQSEVNGTANSEQLNFQPPARAEGVRDVDAADSGPPV